MKKAIAVVLTLAASVVFLLFLSAPASAQMVDVKIVNRQDSLSDYAYFVPGQIHSTTQSNGSCSGDVNATTIETGNTAETSGTVDANCSGSSTTNGTVTPAHTDHYQVSGATFTLLLADGRRVVVNCRAKM